MEHPITLEKNSNAERRARLKQNFFAIFKNHSVPQEKLEGLFEMIATAYEEPHRAYHTLEHIDAFLDFLKDKNVVDRESTLLAVWFHDLVYDTKAHTNEEESAQCSRRELRQIGMPETIIAHTETLIRATTKHEIIANNPDAAIFLDGDLSILGSDATTYDAYAKKIRAEYAWVPEALYAAGRKKILEQFLQREKIFYTETTRANLEKRARENIQREIQQLGSARE